MRTNRTYELGGISEFNVAALDKLLEKGFKYVQVKGLTIDKHDEHVEPSMIVLLPIRKLPTDPEKKDIYEPIKSELLYQWAREINENPLIVIAKC